jgi:hypothetical protein
VLFAFQLEDGLRNRASQKEETDNSTGDNEIEMKKAVAN